jgi:hypothetical protein
VVRALGLEMADLFVESKSHLQNIVETYKYRDEQGNTIFAVVRLDPKGSRQRQPDGFGNWKWNLKGVRPVLYNLPELMNSEVILVCEGEKDVESAKRLGFVATCNSGRAGKWRNEYAEYLRGKQVVIIP